MPPAVPRFHVPAIRAGDFDLPPSQTRHLRDVLRLKVGDVIEAFDDTGTRATATIVAVTTHHVTVRAAEIRAAAQAAFTWTVAAAVPKGQRADWMVEKLAELGTSMFIPLAAFRSVTLPAGQKFDRWSRIAAEASKQSGSPTVMRIGALTPLAELLAARDSGQRWYFSTRPDAVPAAHLIANTRPAALTMLIGPEGGWTDEEIELFNPASIPAVKLAATILRVETAAVAAATIAANW
jgi:16S rRNA (uracil1498-N3)-methyltransferase